MAESAHKWHTKTSGVRVGVGELRKPGSDIALYRVRAEFLQRSLSDAPALITSLEALVPFANSPHSELLRVLTAWARTNRLLERGKPPHWLLGTARRTLRMWADGGLRKGSWARGAASDSGPNPDEIKVYWEPLFETRAAVEKRIAKRLDEIVERHEAHGMIFATGKRQISHLGWLARYLVNREHPEHILRKSDAVAVKKALRDTAKLLGLDLPVFPDSPTSRRGRPLGRREPHVRERR